MFLGTLATNQGVRAARNSRVHSLADEVRQLAAELPNLRTHFRYDAPCEDYIRDNRCDSVGLVDRVFLRDWQPADDAEFYFCGPKPFMTGVYRALQELGADESRIHFEFFGPRQAITTAA